MVYAIKRLGLGLFLIALTSAILLIADRGRPTAVNRQAFRLAIMQHADTPVLADGIRGVLEGLAERGYHEGDRLVVDHFNAQGDMPTGIAIARQIVAGNYDLAITVSTPSMQALANNNREGKVRHVFSLVADPFASGVGLDRSDPLIHPPHMVGQGVFAPVDKAFDVARRMLPSLERIGVAWNPAESNSLIFVTRGREVAEQMKLTLLEANVDSSPAVPDAINSLVARGAQAIWIPGDNTVISTVDTVIALGRRLGIPIFTILPGAPDRGTLFDSGPDFYQVGRQGATLAADVLDGGDMTKMPIRDVMDLVPTYLSIDSRALDGLKEPWRVTDDLQAEASVTVDAQGVHRKGVAATAPAPASANKPLAKKWRLNLIQYVRTIDSEDAEHGVLDGLKEAGLVEGRDFEKTIRDAQNDMATVSALIDASVAEQADLLITFSTPTLQAALKRAKGTPIVFNFVADAIAAGAGTSDTVHAPNVTGVYLIGAYKDMLSLIKTYMPHVRTLGTVYVPAEVNMVSQRDALTKEMQKAGLELRSIAANSSAEVADATLSLVSGDIDAICQIPGNLTAVAFPNLLQVARRAKMPVFVFQTSQIRAGAVAAVARDYYDSGREAAGLAARVMRGESPAKIPFVGFAKTKLIVNMAGSREVGLTPPPTIVSKADEVIGR